MAFELRAPAALPFRDWAPVALPFKDWASAALPFRDWALAALCGHYATMIFSLSNVLNYSLASYLPGPGTSWSDICNLCSPTIRESFTPVTTA